MLRSPLLVATSHCLALSSCWYDHFVKLFTGRGSRNQRVRFEAKNTGGKDRKKTVQMTRKRYIRTIDD